MTEPELIATLITLPAGYNVELYGELIAYRTDDGRFAVQFNPGRGRGARGLDKVFPDAMAAAMEFLRLREEHKIGLDKK